MLRANMILAGILLASGSPREAQAQSDTAATNAFKDMARAQERQAESLRRIESIQRDQARADRNARHDAEVTSRSMRRFDPQ